MRGAFNFDSDKDAFNLPKSPNSIGVGSPESHSVHCQGSHYRCLALELIIVVEANRTAVFCSSDILRWEN